MRDDVRNLLRFRRGLRQFLREPVSADEALATLRRYRAAREAAFVTLLERAVYGVPRSPWLRLLRAARVELGDLRAGLARDGLDATLATMYAAGVCLSLGEATGRQPVVRDGLEMTLRFEDLDNPVVPGSFENLTGGSSGTRRRLLIDFGLLEHDVHAQRLFLRSFDVDGRRMAIWRPVPPGAAGLKRVLLQARAGSPAERWFSQTDPALGAMPVKSWVLLQTMLRGARRRGAQVPAPEYVPLDRADVPAGWLAAVKRDGMPGHLDTIVSSAVRVCQAADAGGLDIAGSFVRVGSEALTGARAAVLRSAGLRFACHYALSETGPVGMGCRDAAAVDDVHVLEGKVAVLPRPAPAGGQALFLTTVLLPAAPRILINVESGDAATVESRPCGCPFGEAGYTTHLHTIRSYEKVNAEGMYFPAAELSALVEGFLPGRWGGAPTDYQFIADARGGLAEVRLVVSPRVGPLQTDAVRDAVLARLADASRGHRMKSRLWQSGDVLRVERGEPVATAAGKILPVHILRGPGA
jgi:hypothetical protein